MRNWLYPHEASRFLDRATRYLATIQSQASTFATLILANGQSYRVRRSSGIIPTGEWLDPKVDQVDDTLYRHYDVSWIGAI